METFPMYLGKAELKPGRPKIAVGFSDRFTADEIMAARLRGANIAELRIDLFDDQSMPAIRRTIEKCNVLPKIATIRSIAEGGGWEGHDLQKTILYRDLIPYVDALDVELQFKNIHSVLRQSLKAQEKKLILSSHNFEKTLSKNELSTIIAEGFQAGADIVKIANMVNDPEDLRTLTSVLIEHPNKPLIMIGMGALGIASRVILPLLGSLITFAAYGPHQTAPGQIPLEDLGRIMATLNKTV